MRCLRPQGKKGLCVCLWIKLKIFQTILKILESIQCRKVDYTWLHISKKLSRTPTSKIKPTRKCQKLQLLQCLLEADSKSKLVSLMDSIKRGCSCLVWKILNLTRSPWLWLQQDPTEDSWSSLALASVFWLSCWIFSHLLWFKAGGYFIAQNKELSNDKLLSNKHVHSTVK